MPKRTPPVPVPVGFKWCFGCSALLPHSRFFRERRQPDGRSHRCRQCRRRGQQQRREIERIVAEAAERIGAAAYRQSSAPEPNLPTRVRWPGVCH